MASYSATGDLNRNTTGLRSDSGKAPYEVHRNERNQFLTQLSFPPSYRTNTSKEELCLQYVDTFRTQFVHLYPGRAPLLLSPVNEWQKPKLICTYIRPTLLPYPDLYDHESCAKFVANFIMYEAVGDGEAFPQQVNSPTTVLQMQVGSSVEMSIVLCSLLLASGYNAHVVLGYATWDVVDNYQMRQQWHDKLPAEVNSDDESDAAAPKATHFSQFLKQRPQLTSKYDAAEAARKEALKVGATAVPAASDAAAASALPPPPRKAHAWVVLLPKARGIDAPVFLEPSTGRVVALDDARYCAIDAIFNHRNIFVNMSPEASIPSLTFDLYDLTVWEHVFLSDPTMVHEDDGSQDRDKARLEDLTSEAGEGGDDVLDVPASWVEPLTLSRTRYEYRFPHMKKRVEYADAVVELFADYTEPDMKVMQVAVRDDLYPYHWQIHTFYKHRHDFLRRRSEYPSRERHQWRKVHDWFLPGRKSQNQSRVEGLRELIEEPGVRRAMRFYWRAREDGLVSRTELYADDKDPLPRKIMEEYRGRDNDRLIYRSGTFEAQKDMYSAIGGAAAVHQAGAAGGTAAAGGGGDANRVPIKMAEKFSRNAKVPASEDVNKRKYIKPMSTDGEIWVRFHYSDDCITQPFRMYPKSLDRADRDGAPADEVRARVVVMPFEKKPTDLRLRDELRALVSLEKECVNELRARADEAKEIIEQRHHDMEELKPIYSVYDTLRNRPTQDVERELERAEQTRRDESRNDDLAPYIANLPNLDVTKVARGDYRNIRLNAEQAKAVRDAVLKDLKERLIQRGHIMQARLDREKEELNRRQIAYQKNLDAAENAKDSEEFARFSTEATWRLKILDDRLTRHIEQATEKYAAKAMQLRNDPRLAAIYEAEMAAASSGGRN